MRRGGTDEQHAKQQSRLVSLGALVVVVALLATACRAETELVTPAEAPTATSESTLSAAEPEPDPAPDPEPAEAEPEPEADSGALAPPTDTPVLIEAFLGFSPDGSYAYDGSVNPWNGSFPCGATLDEPVVGIDLMASSEANDFVTFAGGIDVPGVASGLYFHKAGSGVLVMRCGEYPDEQETLVPVAIAPNGQLDVVGEPYPLTLGDARYQWINGVPEPMVVEVGAMFGADDDYDNWTREIRQIDLSSGDVVTVAEVAFDDESRRPQPGFTTPDGRFTYTEIDDPAGSVGCEGFGIAASIALDDGSGPRPIFGADQAAWSSISDMQFGPDGLVAWTSGCEGYVSMTVGLIRDNGTIADVHWLDTQAVEDPDDYVEFQHLRMLPDGSVVAIGLHWNEDNTNEPRFRVISLLDDPGFVTTGPNPPSVDQDNPILDTIAGTGSWFLGESPGSGGSCDAMSLFASTTNGIVHGVSSRDSLGQIVDVAATAPVSFDFDYGFGPTTVTRRTIVVVTECADEYIGRKVWFGEEPEMPGNGIWLEPADLPAVSDVLSVRDEYFEDDSPWSFDPVAVVVFRDGTEAEVVLKPLPYDG